MESAMGYAVDSAKDSCKRFYRAKPCKEIWKVVKTKESNDLAKEL